MTREFLFDKALAVKLSEIVSKVTTTAKKGRKKRNGVDQGVPSARPVHKGKLL